LGRTFEDCKQALAVCADSNTVILSPLPWYITAGCCNDQEHAPNSDLNNFRSLFISGLERTRKNIKKLVDSANLAKCKVINPLWLLAGPGKHPEAEIINMIEDGWGDDPVHPSNATYEKIATVIISQE
jgi:hypothetical protein